MVLQPGVSKLGPRRQDKLPAGSFAAGKELAPKQLPARHLRRAVPARKPGRAHTPHLLRLRPPHKGLGIVGVKLDCQLSISQRLLVPAQLGGRRGAVADYLGAEEGPGSEGGGGWWRWEVGWVHRLGGDECPRRDGTGLCTLAPTH